jgi:hypothetical protein
MRLGAVLALPAVLALAGPAEARLDRGFADGRGIRTLDPGGSDTGADAVLRTRAGKLLLGGYGATPRHSDPALVLTRLHPSGRTDTRFGRRGVAFVSVGNFPALVAMRELRNRKLLVAFTRETARETVGVVRLHPSGRVDRSYGRRGIARVTLPGSDGNFADMALLPGGRAVVAATTMVAPDDPRVVLARLSADGRTARTSLPPLGPAHAIAIARTRPGHLMMAAFRPKTADAPAATVLTGFGPSAPSRVLEGMETVAIDADRRNGVAVLLTAGNRWGVRRYSETLQPRRAPAKLPSAGNPWALDVAPGSAAWVGFDHGQIGRVRPDGRPDRRFAPRGRTPTLSTKFMLDTRAVASLPRGRAVLVGRAVPRDYGDIREDYGTQRMWIARYRRVR